MRNIENHTYFAEVVVIFSTTILCFFLRKDLYKTVWEIKQRRVLDLAADRGKYIDQSQSLNLGPLGMGKMVGGMRESRVPPLCHPPQEIAGPNKDLKISNTRIGS